MQGLPPEIVREYAKNLTPSDLLNLCRTDKRFNSIVCNNENFWRIKFAKDYPDIKVTPNNTINFWREQYKEKSYQLTLEYYRKNKIVWRLKGNHDLIYGAILGAFQGGSNYPVSETRHLMLYGTNKTNPKSGLLVNISNPFRNRLFSDYILATGDYEYNEYKLGTGDYNYSWDNGDIEANPFKDTDTINYKWFMGCFTSDYYYGSKLFKVTPEFIRGFISAYESFDHTFLPDMWDSPYKLDPQDLTTKIYFTITYPGVTFRQ